MVQHLMCNLSPPHSMQENSVSHLHRSNQELQQALLQEPDEQLYKESVQVEVQYQLRSAHRLSCHVTL